MNEDVIIIWEAPKIEKPEFRLYYDDAGKVICYTCAKPEGNYIVIDSETYAAARPDVRVINGKISTVQVSTVVCKLMPDEKLGTSCVLEDIDIIAPSNYTGSTVKWKLNVYELN